MEAEVSVGSGGEEQILFRDSFSNSVQPGSGLGRYICVLTFPADLADPIHPAEIDYMTTLRHRPGYNSCPCALDRHRFPLRSHLPDHLDNLALRRRKRDRISRTHTLGLIV